MPKQRRKGHRPAEREREALGVSDVDSILAEANQTGFTDWLYRHFVAIGASFLALVLVFGVFAKSGWIPHTDGLTGKHTGWFGREIPKNAPGSWNPFGGGGATPTPTPQLSKEYVYAGSRLLAIEDGNANAEPPADLAVWRPSTGTWYVLGGPGSQQTFYGWGMSGDVPVPGDYDGDGKTDFSIFRPSTNTWWIVKSSDNTYYNIPFGDSSYSDVLVPADYDGDGKTDIAVWRPSTYYFYILSSSTGVTSYYQFGTLNDVPAPADYDGDGRADVAVWRNSTHTFYSVNSSNRQVVSSTLGYSGDLPVPADYDGDGKANYAVKHGADWIIMNAALTSTTTTTWQTSDGVAVPNDYDGDGQVDIAIWKVVSGGGPGMGTGSGYWYIRQSHDLSTRSVQWGSPGDTPVPAFYRR